MNAFVACLAALLVLAAPAAAFDRVLLKDGRAIEGKLLPSDDPAIVNLEIRGVTVPIRADMVDKTYVENLEAYVPKNKKEEDYLKKGWVIFEGNWMSKERREGELKKRATADKTAIDEAKRLQDWRNARTVESRHFIFKTNLDDTTLRLYMDRMEAYYKNFTEFWGITLSPGKSKGKPNIFLYRTRTDFLRITGVPPYVGGFFSPVSFELHLPHDVEDPEEALDTLFHEGNHLLTQMIEPDFFYPIWMNEGMAEYYGTAEIDAKGRFVVGGQQDSRIAAMRREREIGKFRRLRDVLLTEKPSFDAYDYGYAWSFVHFLMESPEYGKPFRAFFANLSNNKDAGVERVVVPEFKGATIGVVELENVLTAFEKRMGKSIDEFETLWLRHFDQAYAELRPEAYYTAAQIALRDPARKKYKNGEHIKSAVVAFEKAVSLGIQDAACYRDYAELLRKGGIIEGDVVETPLEPDQERAWDLIQEAIRLDPLQPLGYTEAAGILLMDGPVQDLDRAADMVIAALAIAGPRNLVVKALHDELVSLIEPAREKRRERIAREAAFASDDHRNWTVAPFFYENQPVPEQIPDLSTAQLRELIRAGTVTAEDRVYQSWRDPDPERPGELLPGTEPWDLDWVPLKDVPVFAEDLAAVTAASPG